MRRDSTALSLSMSFPRFSARFTSRLNRVERTGVTTYQPNPLNRASLLANRLPLP
jgi:hypothetical protein